jgi:DNA repair photolyase
MRWDRQRVERVEDQREPALPGVGVEKVRTFDAPEALGIRFHEVRAKSALNHVPNGNFGFNWTINLYRGCSHACVYCFARSTHRYLDLNPGRDFEREIVVKVNAPEVLRAELARRSWKRELVAIGTNTDPYQWVEGRYRMMPEVLAALDEAETPVSVLTKSPLVLRDIEQYVEMAAGAGASVNLSVPTLDEKVWRATEPHTPHPRARLEAVAELNRRGIDSGVLVMPLMPGINDAPDQVEPLVEMAREANASFVASTGLHLRGEVKDVFLGWLSSARPDLLPRYERLYPGRRAYLPPEERRRLGKLVKGWGKNRRRPPAGGVRAGDPHRAQSGYAGEHGGDGPHDRTRGQESLF